MNIKYIFIFLVLLFSVGLSFAAIFPDAPENLNATASLDGAFLEWDNVTNADGYRICNVEPSIIFANWTEIGISPPTLDGVLDTDVADYSQKGVLRSPNPTAPLDYEFIYALYDSTTMYMAADTIDNDADANDDSIGVYFDFNQDGLTSDDIGYTIQESGTFKRWRWSGTNWIAYGGSTAQTAVGGAGTTNVVYEFEVPLTEFPVTIVGNHTDVIVSRINTYSATTEAFFPYSTGFSITNTTGWQQLYVDTYPTTANITCFNVSTNYYNLTGLDSFSAYEPSVAAINNSTVGNASYIEFITLDYPTYTVSGHVRDNSTLNGVSNALVTVTDSFTSSFTTTNESGYYIFQSLYNDTYILTVSATSYYDGNITAIVSGENLTNRNIDIDRLPTTITYGIVYDDITGEPLHNVKFYNDIDGTLTYSNVSGYYSFETNDSLVYAYKNGYSILSTEYTVSGDTLTDQELYLGLNTNAVPLWFFVLMTIIIIGCCVLAFVDFEDISIFQVVCGYVASGLSFVCSKLIIGGNVVESYEYASTIINPTFSWMFRFVGIAMLIMSALLSIGYIKEVFSSEEED